MDERRCKGTVRPSPEPTPPQENAARLSRLYVPVAQIHCFPSAEDVNPSAVGHSRQLLRSSVLTCRGACAAVTTFGARPHSSPPPVWPPLTRTTRSRALPHLADVAQVARPRDHERPLLADRALVARNVLGWPKRCKLAHGFMWEYRYERLKLAQLLGQLGVFLTFVQPSRLAFG